MPSYGRLRAFDCLSNGVTKKVCREMPTPAGLAGATDRNEAHFMEAGITSVMCIHTPFALRLRGNPNS